MVRLFESRSSIQIAGRIHSSGKKSEDNMKIMIICAVIVTAFLGGASAFAAGNNVADLTNSYVYIPMTYAKVIYDEGPSSTRRNHYRSQNVSSSLEVGR